MKRVTVAVPDEILVRQGGAHGSKLVRKPVTPEMIVRALTERGDYHAEWFFEPGSVQVISIDDAPAPGCV